MENKKMKYYNSGNLGITGTYIAHEDGEHTFIPSLNSGYHSPWIKTKDLHDTYEEAKKASVSEFSW